MTKTMSVKARFVVLVVALGMSLAGSAAASQDANAARNLCNWDTVDYPQPYCNA